MNARPENIVRINGKRSIGLSIYKEMRFNTVKVVDEVTRQLAVIENALPGYHFQVISNQGTFYKSAIGEVKKQCCFGCYPRYCSLVCIPSPDGDNTDCQPCYSNLHCSYFQSDVL